MLFRALTIHKLQNSEISCDWLQSIDVHIQYFWAAEVIDMYFE